MNWDDLRVFDAAARMHGVTAASRVLGVSQPQMSRRLRAFEDKMGARLFDRTPNGLMLTPAGEKLLPLAQQMRLVAEGVERVRPELAQNQRRVLRISLDEVRENFITTHLKELMAEIGDAEIELFCGQVHLNHASRETEIQIRACLPESETLIARKLGETVYGVYASKYYQSADGLNPADDPNWVGFSADRLWYPELKQWMDRTLKSAPSMRFNTVPAQLNAARSGVGFAVLPRFLADPVDDLVRVDEFGDVHSASEHLIVHRDLLREPVVRRAVDAIAALYKKYQPVFSGLTN